MASDTIPAVVAHPPDPKPKWAYEQVTLGNKEPGRNEVLVRMVASGICHTDVFVSSLPHGALGLTYPKIMGHEGAGYVEAIGADVTNVKVGDPVLLSFDYCGTCDECERDETTQCLEFNALNTIGQAGLFKSAQAEDVAGKFFGQSSFASKSIVQENCVVNVSGLLDGDDELKLLSPLGCGLMTGVGAVVNVAKLQPKDILLVTGIGAVGLGAIMAAKVKGCTAIIAVDRVASRLETAKELGATHALDTTGIDISQVAEEIKKLVDGKRITWAVETTGAPVVIQAAFLALGLGGQLIQIGVPPLDAELKLPMAEFFFARKGLVSNILGRSHSRQVVPMMIEWWKQGKFPVEKIVKYFPAKDVLDALHGMESGTAIKPVIVW